MIGKNEEKVLGNCLEAIAKYGYEIVFIDTGSTDQTRNIALKYTDKVYDFVWCDDFSKARNYSLEKASNEYVLVIDCDEIVTEIEQTQMEKIIAEKPQDVGRLWWINTFSRNDDEYNSGSRIGRFFSRKLYRYEGIIHEQPVRIDGCEHSFFDVPITAIHNGYDGDVNTRKKKSQRNIHLLKIELQKNPKDTYVLYQIGKSYYMEENYTGALEYFNRALELNVNPQLEYVQNLVESYGYTLLNTKQYHTAMGLEGVYDEFSHSSDFVFLMGLIYMNNGMFQKAIHEFLKATTMMNAKVKGVNSFRSYYNIGVIYECLGQIDQALIYYRKALPFEQAQERIQDLNT